MKTLALIGAAHIHTPGFIKRINARSDVQVKTVWDHDSERAAKNAAELSAQTTTEISSVWSDSDIDAVIICSETDRHEPLVIAAADAKKPMFVEKPLGMGAADAYKMANAIDAAGVAFQTGYFMRGQPNHLFLRQQIQNGAFGKITRVRHSNAHAGSLGGWFDTDWMWMTDVKQAGIGGFGDLGTHSLDILMWLLGDIDRVTADINVITSRYGDCDESGEGLIKFSNGVIATLGAGWVDIADPVKVLISGTEGHAHVVDGQMYFKSNLVEGADGKSPWTDLPQELPHAFELFLDTIVGHENLPLVTPQEAAARSAVMEAMYKAYETQSWVSPEKP